MHHLFPAARSARTVIITHDARVWVRHYTRPWHYYEPLFGREWTLADGRGDVWMWEDQCGRRRRPQGRGLGLRAPRARRRTRAPIRHRQLRRTGGAAGNGGKSPPHWGPSTVTLCPDLRHSPGLPQSARTAAGAAQARYREEVKGSAQVSAAPSATDGPAGGTGRRTAVCSSSTRRCRRADPASPGALLATSTTNGP